MKRIYITMSGANYDVTTDAILQSKNFICDGADTFWIYDDVWVTRHPFYERHKWLWEHPHKRGFGWYAWKPLIILDALSLCDPGDIVLYTDADTVPVRDYGMLYDICADSGEGVMLFEASGRSNRQWCKRDCYITMGLDQPKYYDCQAGVARFMLFQKQGYHRHFTVQQFLYEWLTYCINPLATTFDPSVLGPELPGFIEHRTEQAILTLLAHKYGYRLYREADQSGEPHAKDKDLFPAIFQQIPSTEYLNVTAPVQGSRFRNV